MNNNKFFLKKILSYIPFLDRFIRKIYYNYKYNTLIIPLDFQHSEKKISGSKLKLKKTIIKVIFNVKIIQNI